MFQVQEQERKQALEIINYDGKKLFKQKNICSLDKGKDILQE